MHELKTGDIVAVATEPRTKGGFLVVIENSSNASNIRDLLHAFLLAVKRQVGVDKLQHAFNIAGAKSAALASNYTYKDCAGTSLNRKMHADWFVELTKMFIVPLLCTPSFDSVLFEPLQSISGSICTLIVSGSFSNETSPAIVSSQIYDKCTALNAASNSLKFISALLSCAEMNESSCLQEYARMSWEHVRSLAQTLLDASTGARVALAADNGALIVGIAYISAVDVFLIHVSSSSSQVFDRMLSKCDICSCKYDVLEKSHVQGSALRPVCLCSDAARPHADARARSVTSRFLFRRRRLVSSKGGC